MTSPWEEAIRDAVLELRAYQGVVTAEAFRRRWGMSLSHARRTLNQAAQAGVLERVHIATVLGRGSAKSMGATYGYRVREAVTPPE